jgi:hypothetical protein
MKDGSAPSVPPEWLVVRVVDSRLEAALAARLLESRGVAARVVARGEQDFALYVAPHQLEEAARTLEPN